MKIITFQYLRTGSVSINESAIMRRFVAVILTLAVLLGYPARADILIGVAGPMTGGVAWSGEQMQRGADMAVADLNAGGGVLGQQVRVVIADDFCDAEQAVAAARKLVSDGVVFVVGHACSDASIPASKVYEAAGVLQISPSSTNPMFTELGRANVFRVIGRDDMQGVVAGDYLADHWGEKKIAILHDGTTYGKGLADATRKQLNKRGITEAIQRSYVPGGSDYSGEMAELKAANVAVLYLGGRQAEVALMARAAKEHGYSIQLVAGDGISSEDFGVIAGSAADGTLFTFAPDPRRNAEAAAVVERFQSENFEPTGYTLHTYGAVQVWAQAIEKAGSLELSAVIASLRSHQFDTVLGPIGFDNKGDVTGSSWIWYVWKSGTYAPVK